jgi:hypothetical protein
MFFTKFPDLSFIDPINRKKLKLIEKEFEAIKDKILSAEFPRIEGNLCGYCDFVQMCEYYTDSVISGD